MYSTVITWQINIELKCKCESSMIITDNFVLVYSIYKPDSKKVGTLYIVFVTYFLL